MWIELCVARNSARRTDLNRLMWRSRPQRRFSDAPIAGTTPAFVGLFALVTLWAGEILKHGWQPRRIAWYAKSHPTVSDTLTSGRPRL